jgi:uncharacterized protein YegP (UPF0339 family)
MAGKFVLSTTKDGQYMFNLKAANGQVILTSERYQSKDGALGGIESVRKNAGLDERYERRAASNGDPYFVLKAANHQEIGRSETYSSQAAMENGIESVKKNAPTATLEDQTTS